MIRRLFTLTILPLLLSVLAFSQSVSLSTPNGGENWTAGTNQYIYWSSSGVTSVKLEYSSNNGGTWQTINASVTASTGYYNWTIPSVASAMNKVRISSTANSSITDMSDNVFSIAVPGVTLITPNGGETWTGGTSRTITWDGQGMGSYVSLDYSINGGSTWTSITSYTYNNESYSWSVPSTINSSNCKIRVTDYYTSTLTDMSDGVFTITAPTGTVTVTTPNGGQNYNAGASEYIYWSSSNITNVKIEYSSDNGNTWNLVSSSVTASTGYYSWTIPNISSNLCKIKISDAANLNSYDISDNVFSISPASISITSPNGGQSWNVGSYQYITWTSNGGSSTVNLQYSTNGGTTWNTIIASTSNSGSYYWMVPSASSSTCKVKVTDNVNSSLTDESDGLFSIGTAVPSITVTTPNSNLQWTVGSSQYIYWNASNSTNVKIEYSTDNGASWTSIVSSTSASTGYYQWTIPNTPSSTCKVKISDVSNPAYFDVSDVFFSIISPAIVVTSPNGGEILTGTSSYTIYWSSIGLSSYVIPEYSTDGGSTWTTIVSSAYNYGYYNWTVPNISSVNCKVRIKDYYTNTLSDQSDAVFTINMTAPYYTITTPNGGQQYVTGSGQYIYWNSSNAGMVTLEYSTNNGSSWTQIATNVNGSNNSYYWSPLPSTPSTQCLVRIKDVSNASYNDVSDATFSIVNPYITVTEPNGGEVYAASSYRYIYWNYAGANYVNVEYSTNNGGSWTMAANGITNYGYYQWYVPNTPSTNCLVRVSDYSNGTIIDQSNSVFTIGASGSAYVQLNAPNGGENWAVGSSQYISWSSSGITNYKLEYSTNDGTSWNTIIASTTGSSYLWTVPSAPSTQCRVRVSDASNASISDRSNNTFTILNPSITVTSPNGGEIWPANSYRYIYWSTAGTSNYVNLEYSTDGGSSWTTITSGYYNYGYYNWYVANAPSTNCRIRVSDYYNTSTNDQSNASFTITAPPATVTVYYPNGGETFFAGSTYSVTWSASNMNAVRIQYSVDNGLTWNTISNSTSASAGSYSWSVPGALNSEYCKIKVIDTASTATQDISNSVFAIRAPGYTFTSPNGGEIITGGTSRTIYWTGSTSNNYYKLYYSIDSGSTWTSLTNYSYNYNSFNWSVPNVSTTAALLKIVDYSDTTLRDLTDGDFTINPAPSSITVSTPNGGENYLVGSSQYIYWSSSNVSNVKIEYSTDGSTWSLITGSTSASTGYYYWNGIPNTPSTTCKIRISDVNNSSVVDYSNTNFTISAPSLTITSPNGGEIWTAGTGRYIYWTGNTASGVKLFYSVDSGAVWNVITNYTSNSGSYYWSVANNPSSTCLIKIVDYSDTTVRDISDAKFSIIAPVPTITVTTPNTNVTWYVGTSQYIYWSSANVSNVRLEYSIDNGNSWDTIVSSTSASSGYYYWTIPNTPSALCKVKVVDASNNSILDISDQAFTISSPYYTITTPNGSEIWPGGSSKYIYWTSGGVSSYVKLEVSTDGGATYSSIASSAYNYGYYNWSVPNTPSTTCRVRISDYYNSSYRDSSDFNFTISSSNPTIAVTYPNGGEVFGTSSGQYINWSSYNVANVKIEYSLNNGSSWTTITSSTSASSGSYYWNVPSTTTSSALIRVSDVSNSTINDISNSTFSIVTPTITVNAPNGGQTWTGLTTEYITWSSSGASSYVNLQYSIDNGSSWSSIVTGTDNDGSYAWTVPNSPSSNCKVRVIDYYNSNVSDISNSTFTILAAPASVTLITPNGGETWSVGSNYYINWSSVSVNYVRIEYSFNNGASWNLVTSSYNASSGYYNWNVPNTPSSTCKVRVSDASNPGVYDVTASLFTIATPQIIVTSPNGGQSWAGLSNQYITWTSSSASSYVTIEYSVNNGTTWSTIVAGTYNSGSYSWNVPNTPSTTCLVRVRDYYNSSVWDVSNASFGITAAPTSIVVTDPNGYEAFGVGTSQYITWSSSGVSNVDIDYSTNGGSTWTSVATGLQASTGYYYWTVPNTPSASCYVRVKDAANATVNDASNAAFTITTPAITLTTPNGGQTYTGNTTQTITWTSTGVSSYVKVEYSADNGASWLTAVTGTYNNGSYSWNVPNISSSTCLVRVSDYYNAAVNDQSNNTFSINTAAAALTLTSPNGGEVIAVNSSRTIYWNSTSVANVRLEYSLNGGGSWSTIVNSTAASTGYYVWSVPSTASATALVRITDVSNPGVFDQSNYVFTISNPSITLNSPNGGENFQIGNGYYITWSSVGVNTVRIEYTTDNVNWTTIVSNYSNYNYYYWVVPNTPGTQCKVRVTSTASGSITDQSNGFFNIITPVPAVSLNSPNGGETWYVGYQYYINWSATAVANVKLEYSTDNGSSWNTIAQSYPASSGFYYWTAPNSPSTLCKIRVSDASNASLNDLSNYTFTIATPTPSITVNYPNGGESWYGNTYHYVSWTANFVNAVELAYSVDSGSTWTVVANNLGGSYYYWNVPNIPTTQALVRVRAMNNSSIEDYSNADFSILAPVVNSNTIVTDSISPLPFCKEDSLKVYYTATGVYNSGNYFLVQLSDSTGSFVSPYVIGTKQTTSLTGYVDVIVPATVPNGSQYRMRVVSDNLPATGTANSQNILINSPQFDFAADETIKYLPDGLTEFTFLGDTANIASYNWDFGDGVTSAQKDPVHNYTSIVYHDVSLEVTNTAGCSITVSKPSYMRVEQILQTNVLNTGTTLDITAVAFGSDQSGCVALSNGNCLVTADSGNTWMNSVTGMNYQINGVWWVPGYGIFIVGPNGSIYYSTNLGSTWTPFVTGTTETFNSTSFVSSSNGYAVGTNGVIYSYNGSNWTPQTSGVSSSLNAVYALNSSTAVALGDDGKIVRTTNGGTSWSTITSPTSSSIKSVYFAKTSTRGYAAAAQGVLLSTNDNGATWTTSLSGVDVDFTSVTATVYGDTAWAVSNSGVIYKTENGGSTWVRYSKGSTNDNTGATFKSTRGYVSGKGGDLKTFGSGIDTTTAIKKIIADVAGFRFYPNPARELVTIESYASDSEIITITLRDMNGRVVSMPVSENANGDFKTTISTTELTSGVYFIHVLKGSTSFVQRLVVVH